MGIIEKMRSKLHLVRQNMHFAVFKCPVCGDESLHVNDATSRFYCFGCEAKGDESDLESVLNLTEDDADPCKVMRLVAEAVGCTQYNSARILRDVYRLKRDADMVARIREQRDELSKVFRAIFEPSCVVCGVVLRGMLDLESDHPPHCIDCHPTDDQDVYWESVTVPSIRFRLRRALEINLEVDKKSSAAPPPSSK